MLIHIHTICLLQIYNSCLLIYLHELNESNFANSAMFCKTDYSDHFDHSDHFHHFDHFPISICVHICGQLGSQICMFSDVEFVVLVVRIICAIDLFICIYARTYADK
jgi:hypothetical protein